ncbi:TonB family protein [uncultured Porphyromonas sp.]|uniref:cell envelope integrity protein TolA n=1 Tax=uncultured Porphyromonas sp. TaxID=159274 RepID=UPI0025FDF984|nr:TonB family protein [uncultured Porphyromonas sp.]
MEEDKRNSRQWISAAIAIGVHILAVGLLFVILMPPIKVPDLPAGILVSIGNMAEAEGTYDPHEIIPPEEVDPVEPIPTLPDEDLLTQDLPDAPEVQQVKRQEPKKAPVKKKDTRAELEKQRQERLREEQKKREAAEAKRKADIAGKVAGALGNAQNASGSGTTPSGSTTGHQGSPTGNVTGGGAGSGVAGFGGWSLAGRDIVGGLKRPDFTKNVEGRIVVAITVNSSGNVIAAAIAPGTTIGDYSMQQSAIKAAKATRFSRADQVNNQRGKITYKYELN